MRHLLSLMLAVTSCSLFVGCDNGVKEEVIEVQAANDPFYEPRALLERYKAGQTIGSESASFDRLVKGIKDVDAALGDTLAKGFEDLKKASSASARKKIATELLGKLAPSIGGPSEN